MRLKHTALYTKNWYKRSDNIWDDIKQTLTGDDYTPFSNFDVISILNRNCAYLFGKKEDAMKELIIGVMPEECWKHGYYHNKFSHAHMMNEELPEYDYLTAVLWFYLSKLQCASVTDLHGLPGPDPRVMPLNDSDSATCTKIFAKRHNLREELIKRQG